jgi:uncharacterized protein (DUF58 family)
MKASRSPDVGPPALRLTSAGLAVLALGAAAVLLWWRLWPRPFVVVAMGFALVAVVVLDAASAWAATPDALLARPLGHSTADRPLTFLFHLPGLRRPVTVSLLDIPSGEIVASVLVTTPEPSTGTLPRAPRGILPWLAFETSARGPLGLVCGVRRHRAWGPVVVGPAPLRHEVSWGPSPSARQAVDTTPARGDDLFRNVREYVRGDPPRLVHWKATAHHGRLMARERDIASVRAVRIVVACRNHGPLTEDALSRVVWTAEEAWRRGWQVRLVTCEPARGPLPPPPLRGSSGRIAPSLFPPSGLRTVESVVLSRATLGHRLALAAPGEPVPEPVGSRDQLVTLTVSDRGDTWA